MQEQMRVPSGTGDGLAGRVREEAILVRLRASEIGPASPFWAELSPGQRAMIATSVLESKLDEGGLEHYFFTSDGWWDDAVRDGLELLGAYVALGFFDRASGTFPGGELPADREDRMELLCRTTAEMWSHINSLEKEFRETGRLKEDLTELRLTYVDAHPEEFFLG